VTATKLVPLANGNILLETVDYRSEFAFDDFADWISSTLEVRPVGGIVTEDMEPFDFVFRDSVFHAGWNDEHGCYVEAGPNSRLELEEMQRALTA
jgi:hypothetical protein